MMRRALRRLQSAMQLACKTSHSRQIAVLQASQSVHIISDTAAAALDPRASSTIQNLAQPRLLLPQLILKRQPPQSRPPPPHHCQTQLWPSSTQDGNKMPQAQCLLRQRILSRQTCLKLPSLLRHSSLRTLSLHSLSMSCQHLHIPSTHPPPPILKSPSLRLGLTRGPKSLRCSTSPLPHLCFLRLSTLLPVCLSSRCR